MRHPQPVLHGPLTEERALVYRLMEKEYAHDGKGIRALRACYQRIAASPMRFTKWLALQPKEPVDLIPSLDAVRALANYIGRQRRAA